MARTSTASAIPVAASTDSIASEFSVDSVSLADLDQVRRINAVHRVRRRLQSSVTSRVPATVLRALGLNACAHLDTKDHVMSTHAHFTRRRPRLHIAGWTALVTGASSGIGAQFARALAAEGADLVLTARRTEQMQQLAENIRDQYPSITITVLPADLAQPDAPARLIGDLARAGITVDLLVNNAGFGTHDRVADEDPARVARQIQVNCSAVAELTTRLLPGMISRHEGGVLNVASTAAFQPVATMAVYSATKAFVLSFTEALWAENLDTGVRVLALCPGGTSTEFFATTGKEFLTRGRQTPAQVVDTALKAFLTSRTPTVISGTRNRLTATGYRFLPRALMARASASTVASH